MAIPVPGRKLHDRLFKTLLHAYLPEFLTLFFPDVAARLSFDRLQFLDQELIVVLPEQTYRLTDVVAEVATTSGDEELILVHIEIEARQGPRLGRRMFEYYSLLRLLRDKPVLPLVLILTAGTDGLGWQVYQESLLGHEIITFTYGRVGLRDLPSVDYRDRGPVAATLATLMQPGPAGAAEVKLNGLKTVINSDLTMTEKHFLINIMETYVPTTGMSAAEREDLMTELYEVELSWAERIEQAGIEKGIEKGIEQGIEQGMRDMLRQILSQRFGPLPAADEERLAGVSDAAALQDLARQALAVTALDEIEWPAAGG